MKSSRQKNLIIKRITCRGGWKSKIWNLECDGFYYRDNLIDSMFTLILDDFKLNDYNNTDNKAKCFNRHQFGW